MNFYLQLHTIGLCCCWWVISGWISRKISADIKVPPEDFHTNGFDGVWDSSPYFFLSTPGCCTELSDGFLPNTCPANGKASCAWWSHLPERHITVVLCSHWHTHHSSSLICSSLPNPSHRFPALLPPLQGISRFGNGFTCKLVSPCRGALSARHLRHAYLYMSVTIKSIYPGVCLSKRCFIGLYKQRWVQKAGSKSRKCEHWKHTTGTKKK